MVKTTKLFALFAKIWKPPWQHFDFFEDWRKFDLAIRKKLASVRLETHLLPYTNNIGPIATQATKNPTFRIEEGPLLSQGARGWDG